MFNVNGVENYWFFVDYGYYLGVGGYLVQLGYESVWCSGRLQFCRFVDIVFLFVYFFLDCGGGNYVIVCFVFLFYCYILVGFKFSFVFIFFQLYF